MFPLFGALTGAPLAKVSATENSKGLSLFTGEEIPEA